ncbi:MAG: CHAP domain-containing protein [Marinilabiliaceae bacterium]|nr:CHAP domain-containing protein [Marinilabiliaceae bacterium]
MPSSESITPTDALLSAGASLQLVPQNLIKSGSIFIIQYKNGMGHCGIVKEVKGNAIITIEGNTNLNHSREGYGVFQHTRKISDINTGFINYG